MTAGSSRLTLPLYLGILDRTNVGTSEGRAPEWHRLGVGWATRPLVCERMVQTSAGCTPGKRAHASASPSTLGIRVVRARKVSFDVCGDRGPSRGAQVRSSWRTECDERADTGEDGSPGVLGTMNALANLAVNYRWMHDDADLLDLVLWLARGTVQPSLLPGGHPRR